MAGPTFQEIILDLHRYWAAHDCALMHPYHTEVGAGTFNPATLLRSLGPAPWNTAYVEPSIRPTDGRFNIPFMRGDFDLVPNVNHVTFVATKSVADGDTPELQIEAQNLVVQGFLEVFTKELPMEYAIEFNRLVKMEMEGALG